MKQENRRVSSARVPVSNWARLLKVCVGLFVVLAIQHFSYEAVAENDAVVAAVPASFPPYYLTDKDGRPIGFAIEVMNEVARGAKVKIRYEIKKDWTAVFRAARAGEVDLIPNVGATTARRSFLDFTDPIETFAISIFTRVSESEIKTKDHLAGRKVGAVAANIGLKIAKKMAGIQVTSFPSFEQAVFALFSGRIDALIYPQAVAWKAATEAGYEHRLKVAGEPLREIKRVIGVRKGEEKLFAALNASANAFLKTPKYREIYQKWFAEAPPFWTDTRVSWTLGGSLFVLFVVLGLWRHYVIVALKKDLDRQVEIRTAELQTSETRNRLILEAAGEGIYGLDDRGVVTFVNPAASKLLGYSAEELIGWPILDIIHHSHPDGSPYPKEETPIFAAIKDGKSYRVSEEVMWRKNGEPLPVQYAITPVPSQNQIDRVVVSFSDITEIKNRELALKRSNSELESFAYVASHDLQEPLRKIQAFSERLEMNYKDDLDARGRDYISRIVDSTIRMRDLIEGLLVLSGVSHKGGKPQKIKLDDILSDVLDDLEVSIQQTGADIHTTPLSNIEGDPTQMRQVFQNIIANALKFSKGVEQPKIDISGSLIQGDRFGHNSGHRYRICIRDNGIGFEPQFANKIFGVFERLHGRSEYSGTGIGLAVTKKIVERHGGDIVAEGEPGKGAAFIITLPLTQNSGMKQEG